MSRPKNEENARLYLNELRTTDHPQTIGSLGRIKTDTHKRRECHYCAVGLGMHLMAGLGVLKENHTGDAIFFTDVSDPNRFVSTEDFARWIGEGMVWLENVVTDNDDNELTFAEIADDLDLLWFGGDE